MFSLKFKGNTSFEVARKQATFAFAVALTKTAKDAQKEVLETLPKTFTIRGTWLNPSNRFGIKIKPATKTNLQAAVYTLADWLAIHEEGGTKTGKGRLTIPTENVRRNKRQIIPKAWRAGRLKNAFVMTTKRGEVLFQRQGRGKKKILKALYGLESSVKIKKTSGFYEPANAAIEKNFEKNFDEAFTRAMATAKT